MDEKTQAFVQAIRDLDGPDRWFIKRWMEMIAPAQRVFVTTARRTGTGPLVLVGKPQPTPAKP